MLAAFEAAWQEVAAEQAAEDADFKRAWDSLQGFRADYKIWKDLGYLD
jgi:TRAP-type mannitol/chloroaromatic compound transport system substrate-binding protein